MRVLTCSPQRKDGPPNPSKPRGSAVSSPHTHRRDPLTDLATDLLRHVANFSEKPKIKTSASRTVADTARASHTPNDANLNASGVNRPHVLSTTSSVVSSRLPADDQNAGKGLQSDDNQFTSSAIDNDNGNALSTRNAKKRLNHMFARKSELHLLAF